MGPPLLFFIFPILFPLGAVAFFGWLGLRFVRAREEANRIARGGAAPEAGPLGRMEETLERLQEEVQALQERQVFLEKLLERPREAPERSLPAQMGEEPGRR